MTSPVLLTQNKKLNNVCPHGVPQSTCPICNRQSMGMGRGVKTQQWSYQKCYAAGLQIRAAFQRRDDANKFYNRQYTFGLNNNKTFQNLLNNNLFPLAKFIKFPKLLLNSSFVINIISGNIQKYLNEFHHAGEKITAIIGEIKNFANRKIFNDFKKKAKKFILFCLSVIDYENYRNDETLLVFKSQELKKYISKFIKKLNSNDSRNNKKSN